MPLSDADHFYVCQHMMKAVLGFFGARGHVPETQLIEFLVKQTCSLGFEATSSELREAAKTFLDKLVKDHQLKRFDGDIGLLTDREIVEQN